MRSSRYLAVSTLLLVLSAPSFGQVQSYLVDSNLDQLFSVDLTTGAATFIASTNNNGLSTPADLAWRGDLDQLWTIDLSGGEVGPIDTTTGVFTPVYQTNLSGWQGMAWDPTTQMYYLANQDDNNYVLDPATGLTTMLGYSGYGLICCLDVDAAGVLWGIDYTTYDVVQVNKTTGVATTVSTSIGGIQGIGIDQSTGVFYAANVNDDSLYTIDSATGASTLIGAHGAGIAFAKGFDLKDDSCTTPYGNGCAGAGGFVPAISMDGCPESLKQVTFHIKDGLGGSMSALLISLGKGSTPLGGSCTLLVAATPFSVLIPLGGTGPGMGVVSLPAVIPANTPPGTIYLQSFVADTASPIGLSASNGLEVTFK